MIKKLMLAAGLTGLLMSKPLAPAKQDLYVPQTRATYAQGVQPQEKQVPQDLKFSVNALGKTYYYATREEADLASKVLDKATEMQQKHGAKPYVWGGDGFESLEEQKKKYGSIVTDVQPAGSWRVGKPTMPGVDNSGLIFQMQLALGFSYGRLTLDGYAAKTKTIIPSTKDAQALVDTALPGDLVLFMKEGRIVHGGIHIGNGYLFESVSMRKDMTCIPEEALNAWRHCMDPEGKRPLQEHGGLQVTDLKSTRITRPMKLTRFKEFLPEKQKYDKKKQPQPGASKK